MRAESSAAADDQPHSIEELAMCQGHVSPMGVTGSLRRSDHRVRYSIRRGSLRSVERTHQRGPAAGRRKVLTCLRGGAYIVALRSQTGEESCPGMPIDRVGSILSS